MTTLLDDGPTQVVRCDDCRRLWPVVPERLEELGWHHDPATDRHSCSICTEAADAR